MKKKMLVLLVLVLAFATLFVSCGKKAETKTTEPSEKVVTYSPHDADPLASGWQKIEEFDEFGDSTGKSEIVLDNQSGTYSCVSYGVKDGKLLWECHTIPNGSAYIILKENGIDANLSTAKFKSDTFTIKIKCDDDSVKNLSGKIALNGNTYNMVSFDDPYDFQKIIASNENLKIVVSCDNGEGSYSLGIVNSGDFEELVFEKSVYNQANELIQQNKKAEAQSLLDKFYNSNPHGFFYLNCYPLYFEAVDWGPAGGYVFYDKGYYSDGWRYLEAAPKDLEGEFYWGGEKDQEFGTQTEIGTGKSNTEKIVKNASEKWANSAAVACDNYSINGYDDWFLPSKDELDMMWKKLGSYWIGDLSPENKYFHKNYWSSSECQSIECAWRESFGINLNNSNPTSCSRGEKYFVRPVRAF